MAIPGCPCLVSGVGPTGTIVAGVDECYCWFYPMVKSSLIIVEPSCKVTVGKQLVVMPTYCYWLALIIVPRYGVDCDPFDVGKICRSIVLPVCGVNHPCSLIYGMIDLIGRILLGMAWNQKLVASCLWVLACLNHCQPLFLTITNPWPSIRWILFFYPDCTNMIVTYFSQSPILMTVG